MESTIKYWISHLKFHLQFYRQFASIRYCFFISFFIYLLLFFTILFSLLILQIKYMESKKNKMCFKYLKDFQKKDCQI